MGEGLTRARPSQTLAANPYVVFADVTLAMAFIFAMSSIALSKALSDITRDQRQRTVQTSIIDLFQAEFPNEPNNPDGTARSAYDQKRNRVVGSWVTPVARVLTNGSYQRIEIGQMFERGSTWINPPAQTRLGKIAEVIRAGMTSGQISYVYFHGICEPGEAEIYSEKSRQPMDDKRLASIRAERVYDLFRQVGALADTPAGAVGTSTRTPKIDPLYAIDYGKAKLYQKSEWNEKTKKMEYYPGRVDLVLFYTDRQD